MEDLILSRMLIVSTFQAPINILNISCPKLNEFSFQPNLTIWSTNHAPHYQKELKTYAHTKTYTQMFKQLYSQLTKPVSNPDVFQYVHGYIYIYMLWYIQTMQHTSVLKRNEL